jgi:hypothetical protein
MYVITFSGENTIIMMTREFDPVTEFPIHSTEFGEGKYCTVNIHPIEERLSKKSIKHKRYNPIGFWENRHSFSFAFTR